MTRLKLLLTAISVATLFALMLVSLGVAAEEDNNSESHAFKASPEQLRLITDLYGQDITLGDYLRIVYPDQLIEMRKEIPKDQIRDILGSKMEWAPLPASPLIATNKPKQDSSTKNTIAISVEAETPSATNGSGEVDYSGELTTNPKTKLNYISITSNLWYWDNGWVLKDSCSNWRAVFWSGVKCNGTYETSDDGFYINTASGYYYDATYGSGTIIDESPYAYLSP